MYYGVLCLRYLLYLLLLYFIILLLLNFVDININSIK